MQVVAKVVNLHISENDIKRELSCGGDVPGALKRLIDRCLLLAKATAKGIIATDEEFDLALLELLDEKEPFGLPAGALQDMQAEEMERLLRNNIVIRKYLGEIFPHESHISDEKLLEFYEENPHHFCSEEMVRCSHIFIRGEDAEARIKQIHSQINSPEDFFKLCENCSHCPSGDCCGDLGFFARGQLFKEIEEVAFTLSLNEISQPLASPEGYHILLLTDKKYSTCIPFEEIKESLASELIKVEKEYYLSRHLEELAEEYHSEIIIYDNALKSTI